MNIKDCPDDMITEYPPRRSGVVDYRIGQTGVQYRGGGRYLCLSCHGADRFQDLHRRGCDHIRRIQRFREERQAELNILKADEAFDLPIPR